MFLNPAMSGGSILANNENAASVRRPKAVGENNGARRRKAFGGENGAAKTPRRNGKDPAPSGKNGFPAARRRRRALGDISNRKAAGGGGAGKGGVAKGTVAKGGVPKVGVPKGSAAARVRSSEAPQGVEGAGGPRVGGGAARVAEPEYDGVFGATTRWSSAADDDEARSLLDLFPDEDLDAPDPRDEMLERIKRESDERDRLELERGEERLEELVRAVHETNERDVEEMATALGSRGVSEEEADDGWDSLDRKLPWEEEDEIYHASKEGCLSELDPYGLWGDI